MKALRWIVATVLMSGLVGPLSMYEKLDFQPSPSTSYVATRDIRGRTSWYQARSDPTSTLAARSRVAGATKRRHSYGRSLPGHRWPANRPVRGPCRMIDGQDTCFRARPDPDRLRAPLIRRTRVKVIIVVPQGEPPTDTA